MAIIEGLVVCFIVLMACVVGISNGAVNLVYLYEKEVQDKVVEMGLITREKIKRNKMLFMLFGIVPCWIFILMRQEDSDLYRSGMNCRQPVRAENCLTSQNVMIQYNYKYLL